MDLKLGRSFLANCWSISSVGVGREGAGWDGEPGWTFFSRCLAFRLSAWALVFDSGGNKLPSLVVNEYRRLGLDCPRLAIPGRRVDQYWWGGMWWGSGNVRVCGNDVRRFYALFTPCNQ